MGAPRGAHGRAGPGCKGVEDVAEDDVAAGGREGDKVERAAGGGVCDVLEDLDDARGSDGLCGEEGAGLLDSDEPEVLRGLHGVRHGPQAGVKAIDAPQALMVGRGGGLEDHVVARAAQAALEIADL